jgi:hypothetical protein
MAIARERNVPTGLNKCTIANPAPGKIAATGKRESFVKLAPERSPQRYEALL